MNKTNSCLIKLLNKSYEIKCPEEEADKLNQSALKLNTELLEIRKKYKKLEETQVYMLAALHICHELITCQAEQMQQKESLSQFISSLQTKIGSVEETALLE